MNWRHIPIAAGLGLVFAESQRCAGTTTVATVDDTSTGHPILVSLRPITSIPAILPSLREQAPDPTSVMVKLPGKMTGGESGAIVFDLVYEGAVKK